MNDNRFFIEPHSTYAYHFMFACHYYDEFTYTQEFKLWIVPGNYNNHLQSLIKVTIQISANSLKILLDPQNIRETAYLNTASMLFDARKWLGKIEFIQLDVNSRRFFPSYMPQTCLHMILTYLISNSISKCHLLSMLLNGQHIVVHPTVVDSYFRILTSKSWGKIFTFPSSFFDCLIHNSLNVDNYSLRTDDIFTKRKILFPIIYKSHWLLISFERKSFKKYTTTCYDSCPQGSKKAFFIEKIKAYLEIEYRKTARDNGLNFTTEPRNLSPFEVSMYDSGVYACINGEYCSRSVEPDYQSQHINLFRQKIVYEILNDCS